MVLIFRCAGGSGMFSAPLEREQMLHNCNRKNQGCFSTSLTSPSILAKIVGPSRCGRERVEYEVRQHREYLKYGPTVWQKYCC